MIPRRPRRLRPRRTTPLPLIAPAVIGVAFLVLPTAALVLRAPWSSLAQIYRQEQFGTALRISLVTSLEATAIALVFGPPVAWMLARVRFPGRSVLRALVTLPLVLPPVVGGVALFLLLGRAGIIGRYLQDWFGLELPFTQKGIVLAQVFVAMPFLIVTLEGGFRSADRGLEDAAATLGASRWRVFSRVTLPMVYPSLVAGTVLTWARALGEFGATVLFGGNLPGTTRTGPTAVLTEFQTDPQNAVALSLPLLAVAVVVLGALRESWLYRTAAP